MTIKAFRKVTSTEVDEINKLSQSVDDYTRPLTLNPLLDGVLLTSIALGTTAKTVPHKLGRPWIGYIVTNLNSSATVYSTSRTLDNKFITLTASAATTADLWVF